MKKIILGLFAIVCLFALVACGEQPGGGDNPGGGEALDRTCTEEQQDETGDQRGDVRVEDGTEGVRVTLLDSLLHTQATLQLFLDTLVDQHVSIHSGTQCQHDTGNTRHGQSCLE